MSDTNITTAQELIEFTLKTTGVLGVGQSALTEDLNDSFKTLNMMIGIWNRKRWLIWHLLDVGVVSTGSLYYTVGDGSQFDVPRPDRIEAAYFRQLVPGVPATLTTDPALGLSILIDAPVPLPLSVDGPTPQVGLQVDFPLQLLESREDYSRIGLKNLSSFARYAFYDSAYPTGKLYTWPVVPATIYEVHILVKDVLTAFPTLGTEINLPPEYYEALWSNLSLRLRTIYKVPAPPPGQDDVKDIAKAALDTIRGANAQISRLLMPRAAMGGNGRLYNILSDGW